MLSDRIIFNRAERGPPVPHGIGEKGEGVKQRGLVSYMQNELDLQKEDIFVNITLYRVPGCLVREFALKVAYKYPGGLSDAIQDLMKNAIKE